MTFAFPNAVLVQTVCFSRFRKGEVGLSQEFASQLKRITLERLLRQAFA
jgi:hypothetical protein